MKLISLILLFLVPTSIILAEDPIKQVIFNPGLLNYIHQITSDFSTISEERKNELDKIALYMQNKVSAKEPISLTYICTHNSRRSHFGQIWAATAAAYYLIPEVKTFSGGTEATAFNERAVAACTRAGFIIKKTSEEKNPLYEVRFARDVEPIRAFSKKYNDASNPQKDFCAIMTCSQADMACPVVKGASARVAVPYDDPKEFDGKSQEAAKYDERCKQIAIETFYVFSQVKTGTP
ncbi:arsenate-mycothiol transferase ArsC [Dyadobacter tibetensis]|uniref:arsenate-mycothiol transferase ArsC n=1 Tax=Dyadobacter tibetensis TaxID=1211851 RepID=UPI000470B040|nr:protein-tyrosine-phosphatase [Dyadobacter tibetensis]